MEQTARPDGVVSHVMAALSYLGILALIPTLLARRDPFALYHARQGIVIWILEVLAVYSLVLPVIGRFFFQFASVLCFVLSVFGLVAVFFGKTWRIPGIGAVAERL
ncbi:MAG: hypothetical protein HQL64_06710 [Magnetococcales bacterium]|nr:hypothetical protein [Magnetococcales bacterium]